ncbi:DUF218 domain-containing protein [Bombardia bombarda]|uniref:DUF218 domain-containing protein n=1 Tax=Bombardia bombarda TaxID=252184 RepID=A0AA40CGE7_9PEZI|nr:DUF218 domain-containing protein [Bombardia bombarda]
MDTTTNTDAALIYNYHRMHMPLFPPSPKTALFVLCSLDLRVARHAARLFLSGLPTNQYSHLVFSGNVGALTASLFSGVPEAEIFAAIARDEVGVPAASIIVEPRATNTGENVRFTHALLSELGLLGEGGIGRFVLVQKPYMERRTWATFLRQWPGRDGVEVCVTSPPLEWDEYCEDDGGVNSWELVVNVMVGDLVRMKEYARRGFQVEQEVPAEVWEAAQRLIRRGFGGHLP